LRWGREGDGNFKVRKAYKIETRLDTTEKIEIWGKVWNLNIWSKVSSFLWLVIGRKMLTWNHLIQKGYEGMSICLMCKVEGESTDHIFNDCREASIIWDKGVTLFKQSNRAQGDIIYTLEHSRVNPYKNPILNKEWNSFPMFLLLNLWKECNRRIFKHQ